MVNFVCLDCGTEYTGDLGVPVFDYCEECDERRHFGTREEYESR